ncbi:Hydroperoxy fatty acid reductase gpx1 [Roseovarius litorisediminis]|uniref:Glutathione peroxidase n=1 Tax=Roseovarius litorisediminis TaxID=1312363 RepID=A0A1Y5RMJ3_9RHOB|nr:glutathione peroxidase [Roseovarius litorisediminis]SLN18437.1 Hydroperoxy fatty acid reductase gpx1 [Roseovarius litorisediminis]
MRFILALLGSLLAIPALALELDAPFQNIDGGQLKLSDWAGQPVLVVNTASRCGFTGQYEGLQTLYDRYRGRGLVVLAVPSDDFRQELGTEAEVKEFCELNYNITLPMTGITQVTGASAHPFYQSVASETGFAPSWNFNKILISPEGRVVATYGSVTRPLSRKITNQIDALLK